MNHAYKIFAVVHGFTGKSTTKEMATMKPSHALLTALLLVPLAAIGGNASALAQNEKRADILLADFEGKDYGDWKTTGEAFGTGPAQGTLPGQMHVDGYKGKGLVNSFFNGDKSVGTLTSPAFKIERNYIAFLIGGGKDPETLAINLLVGGKVVRSCTGPNDKPGGSESLAPASWDVSEFAGKMAVIQIVDNATGPWGHINVDHIVQTDRKPPGLLTDAKRDFKVETRYLNLPIKNGAKARVVTLMVDGKRFVQNTIELADGKPDWWAPMDVSAWKGKVITLMVDKLPEDSSALKSIEPGVAIKGSENLYQESLRGQFHFSPKRGWTNDPNGMVFFNGEYHLFFQHNPYGWNWGNMHWGHAVSKDMVHWEELGDQLLPDNMGPMFSGSAVVDWNNTSGFGKEGKPPLILIYTAAGNPTVQCLAYSTDGRRFTKYDKNPVVKQITGGNRDPKVIWHEATKKWVMALYVAMNNEHTVHFLTSPNMKEWTVASMTKNGGKGNFLHECPDFFELPIDGDAKNRKWVLMAANSEYAIGTFDGKVFNVEMSRLSGQQGVGFYAPQTFADIPAPDGRRIQIGWFQTPTPGMPFNQSMTIPHELKLIATTEGPRLTRAPVKELQSLRAKSHTIQSLTLNADSPNPLADVKAELLELRAEFEPSDGSEVTFTLRGATVRYDAKKQELVVNGHRAPAPLKAKRQRLTVFVDRIGMEVFATDGLTYVPMPFAPKAAETGAAVSVKGGSVAIIALQIHELRSAWKPARPMSP
jgi:fructan beta-fructosidase